MKKLIVVTISIATIFNITTAKEFTNHLKGETSPYLKQHLHNPVDWYPWSKEAFEKAKREHKPIFLSIGYSTCHWCHVMERESFENKKIANILNRYFVAIKVDREEMPDLDKHYQLVYDVINSNGGGWPLTIFMTEDGKPFFAATYIPAEDRYGRRGLESLLPMIAKMYRDNRAKIENIADKISQRVAEIEKSGKRGEHLDIKLQKLIDNAIENLYSYYDSEYGGFGRTMKFPQASRLALAGDLYGLSGSKKMQEVYFNSLKKMALSGLYDQVEGGFFRYTIDRKWTIPHFEKMLYTNSELILEYIRAYRWSGDRFYLNIAQESCDNIIQHFISDEGLFYGSSDADSSGGEGRYFVYDYDRVSENLKRAKFSKDEISKILKYFSITPNGNFDGELSHLHINPTIKLSKSSIEKAKEILKEIRKSKEYPFIDHKNIASWNAMMIRALFDISIDKPKYKSVAVSSYKAFKKYLTTSNGDIYHQRLAHTKATQKGMLEDYAYASNMAIAGYEATLNREYLKDAKLWIDRAIKLFYQNGRWLFSDRKDFRVYADFADSQYSGALATMLDSILKLSAINSDLSYLEIVTESFLSNEAFPNSRADIYPSATRLFLEWKRGIAVLKSKKERLFKNISTIERVKYPYLLIKDEDSDIFTICDMKSCFAYGKDLEKVLERLK